MSKAVAHFYIQVVVKCPHCQSLNGIDYDYLIDKYNSDLVTNTPEIDEIVKCDECGQKFEVEEIN